MRLNNRPSRFCPYAWSTIDPCMTSIQDHQTISSHLDTLHLSTPYTSRHLVRYGEWNLEKYCPQAGKFGVTLEQERESRLAWGLVYYLLIREAVALAGSVGVDPQFPQLIV